MCFHRLLTARLAFLLGSLTAVAANTAALDVTPTVPSVIREIQISRYTSAATAPTPEQRDLLSVVAAITLPKEVANLGEALRWVLRDSGYRLAAGTVLSEETRAMLSLPVPAAHRHFEPLPLKTVIALLIGPAFHLVQDPVHRLLAFERCDPSPTSTSTHPRVGGER